MNRIERDFFLRDESERAWMIESTWCSSCRLPDLGIDEPQEFEIDGQIYLEGRCRICRRVLTSEVHDQRQVAAQG